MTTPRLILGWCISCHQLMPIDADGVCEECENQKLREILQRLADTTRPQWAPQEKAIAYILDGFLARNVL